MKFQSYHSQTEELISQSWFLHYKIKIIIALTGLSHRLNKAMLKNLPINYNIYYSKYQRQGSMMVKSMNHTVWIWIPALLFPGYFSILLNLLWPNAYAWSSWEIKCIIHLKQLKQCLTQNKLSINISYYCY